MLEHLAHVSIRALVLAAIAAVVLWASRGRRTAATEHAVWTAVVVGMLGLFVFGSVLPRLPVRVLRSEVVMATRPVEVIQPATRGTPAKVPTAAVETPRIKIDWVEIGYAGIALAFLVRFAVGAFL